MRTAEAERRRAAFGRRQGPGGRRSEADQRTQHDSGSPQRGSGRGQLWQRVNTRERKPAICKNSASKCKGPSTRASLSRKAGSVALAQDDSYFAGRVASECPAPLKMTEKEFLPLFKAREGEQRVGSLFSCHHLGGHFANGGAVLEAVPGAAAQQPDVGGVRVAVHDEVLIGRILVLTNARFQQRRLFQGGKTQAEVLAGAGQAFGAGLALAVGGIEEWPAGIVGDFEAPALHHRKAVEKALAMVHPDGHFLGVEAYVAGRGSEEENFLAGGADSVANQIRKNFAQPGPAGKYEAVGG